MSLLFATLTASAALLAHSSTVPVGHQAETATAITEAASESPERMEVREGIFMISGRTGNILISTGPDGAFVIGNQSGNMAEQNLALINEVSETPIVFVLNTHHSLDHVGGNEAFVAVGATVMAHDNVRQRISAEVEEGRASATELPTITFSEATTYHWNNQTTRVMHLPMAHTDGDAVAFLEEANVIHTGDILFSGLYPFINIASGGTVDGILEALRTLHDMADAETAIVPGHGPLSTKSDLADTIDMISAARDLVRLEMMKGLDRDAVIAANPLAEFNETYTWAFVDGDRMTGQLFDDLMASDERAATAVRRGPTPATRGAAAEENAEPSGDEDGSAAAQVIEDLATSDDDDEPSNDEPN